MITVLLCRWRHLDGESGEPSRRCLPATACLPRHNFMEQLARLWAYTYEVPIHRFLKT